MMINRSEILKLWMIKNDGVQKWRDYLRHSDTVGGADEKFAAEASGATGVKIPISILRQIRCAIGLKAHLYEDKGLKRQRLEQLKSMVAEGAKGDD